MDKKTPKVASVISLGCSKNLVDSEQLLYQLQRAGYRIKHNSDDAEGGVVIINTCGFIQEPENWNITGEISANPGKLSILTQMEYSSSDAVYDFNLHLNSDWIRCRSGYYSKDYRTNRKAH
jgi:hypothetical protein